MNSPLPISPEREPGGEGLEALGRAIGVFFLALRVLIVAVLVLVLLGGFFQVKEHEEAMLFRFGRLVTRNDAEGVPRQVLRSGTWYWKWPYPVEAIKRIPAQRSVTVDTGPAFWPKGDPNRLADAQKGAPPPPSGGPGGGLRPGEDGYMLTGDANIMHMIWTLTYRVADARQYYLGFIEDAPDAKERRGVERLIASALTNAALDEVAGWHVEDVLRKWRPVGQAAAGEDAPSREFLSDAVRRRVAVRLEGLDLGIEIQQVSLAEVQPPVATQQAFREVFEAAAEATTELDRAEAHAKRVVTEAEGRASQATADARAYQTRVVESVKASAAYFVKVEEEYRKNPETMLVSLYADTVRDILKKAETKYVVHARETGTQEVRLLLGPEPDKPKATESAHPAP